MHKKMFVYAMILILFATSAFASKMLDTYYPLFKNCLTTLGCKFQLEDNTYKIQMDYRALLLYMEDLDQKAVISVASIALEWNRKGEFPKYDALFTEAGKRQLAAAIQTAQAKAILNAAESILSKGKVWL